uniref:Reverse transcriptase domain-containing protein n=1 Tax=Beta vulgaris subsp. vulgaris TaxID=3555 RepID=F4NCF7_BETVV|nr:hypothetical protein [Beta vulgaris subsp. vulgaris]
MSVLSWNIRGLTARVKRSAIRKLIQKHTPDFVFVQETKMEGISLEIVKTMWKSQDVEWTWYPSVGNSGGLISMWNKSAFSMKSSSVNQHWIAISGSFSRINFECILFNVYNPNTVGARASVWEEIVTFHKTNPLPSLLIGDFNETLEPDDRGSLLFSNIGTDNFKNFLQVMELLEVSPSNKGFTWFRGRSKSVLDRLLLNPEWINEFPSMRLSLLQRGLSDHCPLLTNIHTQNWGPKPFRFQNCWLTDPHCLEIVNKTWLESTNMPMIDKLRRVKIRLKAWNRDEFGHIDTNIKIMEDEIQKFDTISNERELDEQEIERRKEAQSDLWMWMKRKELYWAQNSRILWLKHGDRNTKFFHMVASNKKRRNFIASIKVNGRRIEKPNQIKEEAVTFFKEIFTEEFTERPTLEGLQFNQLSQNQADSLIQPFSDEEIDYAVNSCASDKAPGPDGFNFKFIKNAWETIKEDVYTLVREFWATSKLPKGSNSTFITLIPKIDNPENFKDFRPISMVGCVYKIIAKLMAKRIQRVMSSLIGPLQSSYVEGRQILDGALVASEVIDLCKRKKMEAILLKLDFHKAYDSVSWSFLQWTLAQMKFPPQWCKWVMACVASASASILINGSPSRPFKLHRGLRQGDPLSPFLFVIIGEALNQLIIKATRLNLWRGIETSRDGPMISHLQYADDTLVFSDTSTDSLKSIKSTLILFQLVSGLQVNFHKSSLIGLNISDARANNAANLLQCKVGSIPFTYLGLPIGGNPSRIQFWKPVIEKLCEKLAMWKSKMLSIGGRLTLIKSSLASLPLYFMSLFPIPKGVVEKINMITRRFLWSGCAEKKTLPPVSWKVVQLPKSRGGLNIGNVMHKNLAMLFKWIWRFFQEPNNLWCKVIKSKYNYAAPLTISSLTIPKSGGPWSKICTAILNDQAAKSVMKIGLRKIIGNGGNTLFWLDPWISSHPLKILYPRLFSIAIHPNASVAAHGFWEGYFWVWSFSWRRNLRPRDKIEKANMDALLKSVCPSLLCEDKLAWTHDKSGKFSTKSFNAELDKLLPHVHQDAVKGVWRGLVPHRIEIFVWSAMIGKINTRHKLATYGIIPVEDSSCPMCNSTPETSDHLLLHCLFAQRIWTWWLDLWSIKWVFPMSLRMAFDQWQSTNKSPFFKKIWASIFFIVVWSVWKERNDRIFNNKNTSIKDIRDMVLLRLGWWISGWSEKFPYSPLDIQRNPSCLRWEENRCIVDCSPASVTTWQAPGCSSIKWNVDASVDPRTSCSAIGRVLRNQHGNFMCLFSSPIPPMEINCAEVLAIHRAISISLASDSIKDAKIILESDSANAVSWCNGEEGGPWNMSHHLNFIRNARNKFLDVTISHKGRGSNMVADALAKQGLRRQDEFIAWL